MLKWAAILGVAALASAVVVVSPVPEWVAAVAMALTVLFLAGAASFAIPYVTAGWAEEQHDHRGIRSRRHASAKQRSQPFHPR